MLRQPQTFPELGLGPEFRPDRLLYPTFRTSGKGVLRVSVSRNCPYFQLLRSLIG
jgi:hypothetical protein